MYTYVIAAEGNIHTINQYKVVVIVMVDCAFAVENSPHDHYHCSPRHLPAPVGSNVPLKFDPIPSVSSSLPLTLKNNCQVVI